MVSQGAVLFKIQRLKYILVPSVLGLVNAQVSFLRGANDVPQGWDKKLVCMS